ncbi:hypothetical protein IC762_06295 [Bradyrhizobium genosp. L]|uniref:hypothetical protein n=1 Tax=Bradyrhizobium genosp. L TaxID=83637 RepID=UPI0018A31217|nr:hypothetical protein [Bradyrhizobium genosp. L]QPF85912.1 hypothetical protein IC762_06295 [Bradyrhizobium genosp. L]
MATQPNHYDLSGHGIHVTYSTTSFSGKPLFTYHDAFQTKNFMGDEIKTESSTIGTLVSVFIMHTIDGPQTSFTVLIPNVRMTDATQVIHISTQGVTTLHKFGVPPPPPGQTELYTMHSLQGTARVVVS